ncbi:MAG: hypothetical protein JNL67_14050 [Planctomycetaceae bacterium]|nr:hypothetical protein [Planctomycetaceae bacterium]
MVVFAWVIVMACGLCLSGNSFGQEEETPPPRNTKPKQDPPKAKLTVTEVELTAKDGFPLKATWYEGDKGTAAGALLMLHDVGRSRKDFEALATFFADNGHCVLVPDLRGHGASVNDANGNPFAPKKYGPAEALLLQADIEACKKFLVQKNDAEVCNIELMSIVVCGAMSIPALQWSVVDWSYLPAAVKQGQDVKAVVMLGPVRSYQSLQINPLLKLPLLSGAGHPQPLELLLVSGEKSKSFRDTKSIYSSWAVSRGRKDEADDWKKHNIYLLTTDSAHDGIASVMQHTDIVPDAIFDFLENRVLNRAEEYGHKTRTSGKPNEKRPPAPGGIAPGKDAPGKDAPGKDAPGKRSP